MKTDSIVTNGQFCFFGTDPIPIALSSYSLLVWVKLDHTNADSVNAGVMSVARNDHNNEHTGIIFGTDRYSYDSSGIRRYNIILIIILIIILLIIMMIIKFNINYYLYL